MSQSNHILNIKDKNIKLNKNNLFYEKFDSVSYKIIEGTLLYEPPFCTHCSYVFNRNQTYKKIDFKSSNILLLDVC